MIRIDDGVETEMASTPIIPAADEQATAVLRQTIYRLFAALFLYPDAARLDVLRQAAEALLEDQSQWHSLPFAQAFRALLLVLQAIEEEDYGRIAHEYNRLFEIKPLAPPYEAYYSAVHQQARGLIAAQVERQYEQTGLTLSPDLNELPDHIAVELEFMSYLCGQEAAAWALGEADQAEYLRETRRMFLSKHLGRWLPLFARRVKSAEPRILYDLVVEVL